MTRKEAILQAAAELFVEKGYNGTSTVEIAERAGVAPGTIFHHFGKKEVLLFRLAEVTLRDFLEMSIGHPLDDLTGLDALEQHLRHAFSFLDKNWNNIYVLMQEMPQIMGPDCSEAEQAKIHNLIKTSIDHRKSLVEAGVADGSIRPGDIETTSYLIECLLSGIIHTRMRGLIETPDNSEEVAIDMLRSALGTKSV